MSKTLAEMRLERGLVQADLASRALVTLIENGKRLPGPKALKRMAEKLALPCPTVMAACRASAARAKGRRHARRDNRKAIA